MGVSFIVPQGTYTAPAKLINKTITQNGTYNAVDDNANGYSSVTVNVEGGGSGVTVIPEQQFTGEYTEEVYFAILDAEPFGDVTLNVTYDDNTYEQLRGTEADGVYFYGGFDPETGVDFSVYPFAVISEQELVSIVIDNGNTHTISATAVQSSGDYTTAKVTITNDTTNRIKVVGAFLLDDPDYIGITTNPTINSIIESAETVQGTVVLYKGNSMVEFVGALDNHGIIDPYPEFYFEAKGEAVFDNPILFVSGDCGLTISDTPPN